MIEAPPARPATGRRLLLGPGFDTGAEALASHQRRLGRLPLGGPRLLDELAQSGLRGRGGAGFPAARKWADVVRNASSEAVVVANLSEGEPLSRKDAFLAAHRPHLVLDGAAAAATTVGAPEVVLYLNKAAPDTAGALARALSERANAGLADPPFRIVRTSHRYVAGESSAVVNRAAGGSAKPRWTLAHATERGVDDRPTLVQNAETLAHVAMIARFGAAWFRELGTAAAPGTALMTVTGSVERPGVYEADLASTAGGVLAAAGGPLGAPAGALLGGYFGRWIHGDELARLPLADPQFGCGVLAVLPGDGCGVVEASRILAYLAGETAGQCGPCVNGLRALSERASAIAESRAGDDDVRWVSRWIGMVRGRGACHHPDGAVGQLESALTAFSQHLESHLSGKVCAGLGARGFPQPPRPGRGWR